jgi:hypothetical protein
MIGGTVLVIIGIIFIVIVFEVQTNVDSIIPQVQEGQSKCNSVFGRLGQVLLGSIAERCQTVNKAPMLIAAIQVMIIAFEVVAVICIIAGVILVVHDKRAVEIL